MNVAVYWDFENIHASVLDHQSGPGTYNQERRRRQQAVVDVTKVIDFIASRGPAVSINRAYANWEHFGPYRRALQEGALELVQHFPVSNTKNGADLQMAVHIIDDLRSLQHIEHVVLVGGDSDFIPVAQHVRRLGRTITVIGVPKNTSSRLVAAVDEFHSYLDITPDPTPADATLDAEVVELRGRLGQELNVLPAVAGEVPMVAVLDLVAAAFGGARAAVDSDEALMKALRDGLPGSVGSEHGARIRHLLTELKLLRSVGTEGGVQLACAPHDVLASFAERFLERCADALGDADHSQVAALLAGPAAPAHAERLSAAFAAVAQRASDAAAPASVADAA